MYDVRVINPAWFGGQGFIAGKPVVRLLLGQSAKSRKMSDYQIAQHIASIAPMEKDQGSRWVAITGDTHQADNRLLLMLRHRINKLAYIESNGVWSMNDESGRLPIWDHVCLRTTLPADPTKIPMFHSVIIDGQPTILQIEEFEESLRKIAYNGDRYMPNSKRARSIVKRFARNWRITESIAEISSQNSP